MLVNGLPQIEPRPMYRVSLSTRRFTAHVTGLKVSMLALIFWYIDLVIRQAADFHIGVTFYFDQGQTTFIDRYIGVVRKRSQPPDQFIHIDCHGGSLAVD